MDRHVANCLDMYQPKDDLYTYDNENIDYINSSINNDDSIPDQSMNKSEIYNE
jgi:hypothetical protein